MSCGRFKRHGNIHSVLFLLLLNFPLLYSKSKLLRQKMGEDLELSLSLDKKRKKKSMKGEWCKQICCLVRYGVTANPTWPCQSSVNFKRSWKLFENFCRIAQHGLESVKSYFPPPICVRLTLIKDIGGYLVLIMLLGAYIPPMSLCQPTLRMDMVAVLLFGACFKCIRELESRF